MASNSYDVIVGLHTLHAAPNVETCLASLRGLLVPGGSLLIVELDGTAWGNNPGNVWLDRIFGSFSEWFGYSDGREHCTMAPASWKAQLETLGFINVQTSVEDGRIGRDFFFVAQKSLCCPPSVTEAFIDPRYIYTYHFGKEIELQKWFSVHDPTASIIMHILALQGRDGDAAVGLCPTSRKEFPAWDIRLYLFESASHIADPFPLVSRHTCTFGGGDNVALLDRNGVAHVSRIVLSPPPSKSAAVPIKEIGPSDDFGISSRDLEDSAANHPPDILGALLISFIPPPAPSSPNLRILIAIENSELACILAQHISIAPRLKVVTTDFTASDTFQRVDVVFSDSRTYAQHAHLRRWVVRSGKVILWDELLKTEIRRDPSYIGRFSENSPEMTSNVAPVENGDIWSSSSRSCASPPLRADRAYVLLGGIGGLGVDLAVWLYEVCFGLKNKIK
jgi:hypothetical protein